MNIPASKRLDLFSHPTIFPSYHVQSISESLNYADTTLAIPLQTPQSSSVYLFVSESHIFGEITTQFVTKTPKAIKSLWLTSYERATKPLKSATSLLKVLPSSPVSTEARDSYSSLCTKVSTTSSALFVKTTSNTIDSDDNDDDDDKGSIIAGVISAVIFLLCFMLVAMHLMKKR